MNLRTHVKKITNRPGRSAIGTPLVEKTLWLTKMVPAVAVFSGLVWMGVSTQAHTAVSPFSSHAEALQQCPAVEEEIVDLSMLAQGLKDSKAVGLIEKIRLKKAIDGLISRFSAYHVGDRRFSMGELQQQYDVLLMRIASHLQHKDLLLHQQLCNAWELIWQDLENADRFSEKFS